MLKKQWQKKQLLTDLDFPNQNGDSRTILFDLLYPICDVQ